MGEDMWYYVYKGERQGPVPFDTLKALFVSGELKETDMVWTNGFENWKKIIDVEELIQAKSNHIKTSNVQPSQTLLSHAGQESSIFIKIGLDRGLPVDTEYGPYDIKVIKSLFEQKRINAQTMIFFPGMTTWLALAEFVDFKETFNTMPPVISDSEKRQNVRRPFVARLFIENNQKVFEGVCRDISVGGMQVLVRGTKLKASDRISINVHPENTDYNFVANGEVVRVLDGDSGFSFRFIALNNEAQSAIERYLES